MNTLLIHLEDTFEPYAKLGRWDLVVDLGRAPRSTYEEWSRLSGCRAISLFDFAEEGADLHHVRSLLQLGMGLMVDQSGIDWWDILSLMIVPDLLQITMVHRLAGDLGRSGELHVTRSSGLARALAAAVAGRVVNLESGAQRAIRRLRHYRDIGHQLDAAQILQVAQDKFDPQYKVRRRLNRQRFESQEPVVLLPSAYVNASRTAVAFAAALPSQSFLLITARRSGCLDELPPNVRMSALDSYFVSSDRQELQSLQESWTRTESKIVSEIEEFRLAKSGNMLDSIPSMLGWGVAIRDAWNGVFDGQNIVGCLSADDSNPYSRIPLLLAKKRSLPSLACHHGALDSMMAVKRQHASFNLAKSDMERDYLENFCQVSPEKIVTGVPWSSHVDSRGSGEKTWLAFFSEPYQAWSWRSEEVYRELLPRLSKLSDTLGLTLVLKIHPFESVKYLRRLLRRYLGAKRAEQVLVIGGPLAPDLGRKIAAALTVQSTVALDCARSGIPIFLCGWLRDVRSGYVRQFERFGAGQVLASIEQLDEVPGLLAKTRENVPPERNLFRSIDPESLRELLSGSESTAAAPRTRAVSCG